MDAMHKIIFITGMLCLPLTGFSLTNLVPNRAALVDTGYDVCAQTNGQHCENNKNLLFRGNVPLDLDNNYQYDANAFRKKIFSYLQDFQQVYTTNAHLPKSAEELKNYRIVMINLLYDETEHGDEREYAELTAEFKYSGATASSPLPIQHKIYNLQANFNPDSFAFEWWPLTMLGTDNHNGIPGAINWPQHETVPIPRSDLNYVPMDLPYLVTGTAYGDDMETEAMDLRTLLADQPQDGHPLLIFFHCMAGIDRTGATTMSYLMANGGYANVSDNNRDGLLTRSEPLTYAQALAALINNHYPDPDEQATMAAQAFCEYSGRPANECEEGHA